MDNKKLIAQRINSALAMRHKKQKELAKAIGVTDNTISYFCSGNRTPNLQQIVAIAKALDVSTDYLLGKADLGNSTADEQLRMISEYTGLSNKAVSRLHDLSQYIKAHPAGFVPNPYDVLLAFDGPDYTLQPDGKRVSASEVFRVSLIEYLHERSTEIHPNAIKAIDDETNAELLSLSEQLAAIGYTVVAKQQITESQLQTACDAIKDLFREYGDNMREVKENGKH